MKIDAGVLALPEKHLDTLPYGSKFQNWNHCKLTTVPNPEIETVVS